MARKKRPVITATPAAAAAGAVNELDILHPERELKDIGGRNITVREYGFVEGMRVRSLATPFIEQLYAMFSGGTPPTFNEVQGLLDANADLVVELMALATDTTPEWIGTLNDPDGQLIMLTWWSVNASFFIKGAIQRHNIETQTNALLAGLKSMQSLLPTDTTAPSSATTPSGS